MNSSLIDYTKLSHNYDTRDRAISKITIHHMAGNLTVETCGNVFASSAREASANYGIGSDGRVGLYVEEKNRSWASSNRTNDMMAVTIEVANDGGAPNWHVSDKALAKLIDLCVDICRRNGIPKLNYTGDASGNLTTHKMFIATTCPGPYLESQCSYIASEVNRRLDISEAKNETIYVVAPGDTLSGIAAKHGMTYQELAAHNGLSNPNIIYVGQRIKIPCAVNIDEVARAVIRGEYGNGAERKTRLIAAGYDYVVVQNRVNEML